MYFSDLIFFIESALVIVSTSVVVSVCVSLFYRKQADWRDQRKGCIIGAILGNFPLLISYAGIMGFFSDDARTNDSVFGSFLVLSLLTPILSRIVYKFFPTTFYHGIWIGTMAALFMVILFIVFMGVAGRSFGVGW